MSTIDLTKYGITDVKEIVHNPSYEVLFAEETNPALEGYEKGQLTELDTVNVMTGIYTGRSPKDKFFVKNEASEDTVWWTSDEYKNDNKPCTEEAWNDLRAKAVKQLSGKKLYVVDTFCGTNEATRLKVRFIMEVAWQAHFVTNMFIRPTAEELANYGEPDFVCYNASKASLAPISASSFLSNFSLSPASIKIFVSPYSMYVQFALLPDAKFTIRIISPSKTILTQTNKKQNIFVTQCQTNSSLR